LVKNKIISRCAATVLLSSLITKIQNGGQHNIKQSDDSDTPLCFKKSLVSLEFLTAVWPFFTEKMEKTQCIKKWKDTAEINCILEAKALGQIPFFVFNVLKYFHTEGILHLLTRSLPILTQYK